MKKKQYYGRTTKQTSHKRKPAVTGVATLGRSDTCYCRLALVTCLLCCSAVILFFFHYANIVIIFGKLQVSLRPNVAYTSPSIPNTTRT